MVVMSAVLSAGNRPVHQAAEPREHTVACDGITRIVASDYSVGHFRDMLAIEMAGSNNHHHAVPLSW
jgi:hypothetical protein